MKKILVAILAASFLALVFFQNCAPQSSNNNAQESNAGSKDSSANLKSVSLALNGIGGPITEKNSHIRIDFETGDVELNYLKQNKKQRFSIEDLSELKPVFENLTRTDGASSKCGVAASATTNIDLHLMSGANVVHPDVDCVLESRITDSERVHFYKRLWQIFFQMLRSKCSPEIPEEPKCGGNEQLITTVGSNLCDIKYECRVQSDKCKEGPVYKPACSSAATLTPIEIEGCLVGYRCKPKASNCTTPSSFWENFCPADSNRIAIYDPNFCESFIYRCESKSCPSGESTQKEINECIKYGLYPKLNTDSRGCTENVECVKEVGSCPDQKSWVKPTCPYDKKPQITSIPSGGCPLGFTCVPKCPNQPSVPKCQSGTFLKPTYDSDKCITEYICQPFSKSVPMNQTQIDTFLIAVGQKGLAASHECKVGRACSKMVYIGCNTYSDGPSFFIETEHKSLVSTCGGACMFGTCTQCPPDNWGCEPSYQ